MSSPRLEPWLMPDTISSGLNSISPSAAKRTQSTGVPSVAKPHRAVAELDLLDPERLAVVMLRAVALAVGVRRDHRQLDARDLEQRPPHRVQAGGLDAVVVGEQDLHRRGYSVAHGSR